jgi:predicted GNAT family N-acyltransferase
MAQLTLARKRLCDAACQHLLSLSAHLATVVCLPTLQAAGKKRMKSLGRVDVPQEVRGHVTRRAFY